MVEAPLRFGRSLWRDIDRHVRVIARKLLAHLRAHAPWLYGQLRRLRRVPSWQQFQQVGVSRQRIRERLRDLGQRVRDLDRSKLQAEHAAVFLAVLVLIGGTCLITVGFRDHADNVESLGTPGGPGPEGRGAVAPTNEPTVGTPAPPERNAQNTKGRPPVSNRVTRVPGVPVRLAGVLSGAQYEIRVPANWTGTLVVYAHGLRNVPDHLRHRSPQWQSAFLSETAESAMLAEGYAIAGSAYRTNGWAVEQGIVDLRRLVDLFEARIGTPQVTLLAGFSMGSVIALSEAERSKVYDGVLAGCPIGAGTPRTFDGTYRLALAYEAVFGWPASWGTPEDLRDDIDFGRDILPTLIRQRRVPGGHARFELIRILAGIPTGPEWPWRVWGFATETRAELERRAGGPIVQNIGARYAVSPQQRHYLARLGVSQLQVNRSLLKMGRHRTPPGLGRPYVDNYAAYTGAIDRPVILLGTQTDALIPPGQLSAYNATVHRAGTAEWMVMGTTKGDGHCKFTMPQLVTAIEMLNRWVRAGEKPLFFPTDKGFH
jgi:hypothetical protein